MKADKLVLGIVIGIIAGVGFCVTTLFLIGLYFGEEKTAAKPETDLIASMDTEYLDRTNRVPTTLKKFVSGTPNEIDVEWMAKVLEGAKAGNEEDQILAGLNYQVGKNVPKDFDLAVYWYKKAAERGNAEAQHSLGTLLIRGQEKPDYQQAAPWLMKAAQQDHPEAIYEWARLQILGRGTPVDMKSGFALMNKAAKMAVPKAQLHMGRIYQNSEFVTPDLEIAAKWFREAAYQGEAQAQYELGKAYYFGHGVEKSSKDALYWCQRAANQGNNRAQWTLASIYIKGDIAKKNLVLAYKWAILASNEKMDAEGVKTMDSLKANLSASQKKLGQRLADNFKTVYEYSDKEEQ